jgi:predicted DCC family thiol-disulfide oxidoreductase YuxK
MAEHPGAEKSLFARWARREFIGSMIWTLFFDGDCAFCSRSARLVARLDKRERVRLAPLQGELGRERGLAKFADGQGGTMVVLRESDGAAFLRSEAAIELGRALGGIWRLARVFKLVPRPLRDGVYRLIARNRGRLMGKSDSCPLHDPAVAKRLRP